MCAKLRKNERNAKEKALFLLNFRVPRISAKPKFLQKQATQASSDEKSSAKQKNLCFFAETREFPLVYGNSHCGIGAIKG